MHVNSGGRCTCAELRTDKPAPSLRLLPVVTLRWGRAEAFGLFVCGARESALCAFLSIIDNAFRYAWLAFRVPYLGALHQ